MSPDYRAPAPTHDELAARSEELGRRHRQAWDRVHQLASNQRTVGQHLRQEIAGLKEDSAALSRPRRQGVLSGLLDRLGSPRVIRSHGPISQALLSRYELASSHLRAASAYADELQLCAHELQRDLDALHAEIAQAEADARAAAVHARTLQTRTDRSEEARERDALGFARRRALADQRRYRQAALLAREALEPTRRLRDAALDLHDDVSRFTMTATHTLQGASRHVHALGLAAEAPGLVADLHESMGELTEALRATEAYVARAQAALKVELPRLRTRLREQDGARGLLLSTGSADEARADHEEAEVEVRTHLIDDR